MLRACPLKRVARVCCVTRQLLCRHSIQMINTIYFVELLLQGLFRHVGAERVFTRLQSRRWHAALRALLMAQPQAYRSQ